MSTQLFLLDLGEKIGRLLQRSDDHSHQLHRIETRVIALERRHLDMPRTERNLKIALAILAPLLSLIGSGSAEKLLAMVERIEMFLRAVD